MNRKDLEQNYKNMIDEKLVLLAGNMSSLSEVAKEVLTKEINFRGLEINEIDASNQKSSRISSTDFINQTTKSIFEEEHKDAIELIYADRNITKFKAIVFYILGIVLILTGILAKLPMLIGIGVLLLIIGTFYYYQGNNDLQLVFYPKEIMYIRHSDLLKSKKDFYNLSIDKKFERIGINKIKSIDRNSKLDSAAALEINLNNGERIPINIMAGNKYKDQIIKLYNKTYQ